MVFTQCYLFSFLRTTQTAQAFHPIDNTRQSPNTPQPKSERHFNLSIPRSWKTLPLSMNGNSATQNLLCPNYVLKPQKFITPWTTTPGTLSLLPNLPTLYDLNAKYTSPRLPLTGLKQPHLPPFPLMEKKFSYSLPFSVDAE